MDASSPEPLTAERWRRIEAAFQACVGSSEPARSRVLEEFCGGDVALLSEMRSIFDTLDRERNGEVEVKEERRVEPSGKRFGNYELIRLLGWGGMGSVYLAHRADGEFTQVVAVKVLGANLRNEFFTERFRSERQILANLDHPNITRLLDGGVNAEGDPYLVIEFVDGIPINEYCDKHQSSISERIALFLQVCSAVEYAHRNLVVHRDLKPSNIFVTGSGIVKLLDFGTAKLLSVSESDVTMTRFRMLTPRYASPEQLRCENVTTLSDVYSLGIVLYEIVTGHWPFGNSSFVLSGVERAVRDLPPINPKTVRPEIPADLANILLKALQPETSQRYQSVQHLAEDLQRFLDGRPVLARPQTLLYMTRRFAARHRGKVMAATAVFVALLAVSIYGWERQQQAVREGQRAVRMQTLLYRVLQSANSNYTGKPAASVQDLLQLAVRVLPDYVVDPTDLRQGQLALAESMYGNHDYAGADRVLKAVAASAKQANDVAAECEALAFLGQSEYNEGQQDAGLSHTAEALRLSKMRGVPPRTRALSAMLYASEREDMGRHTDENVQLLQFAVNESRSNKLPPHEVGEALTSLADVLQVRGRLDEAQQNFREALAVDARDPLSTCDQADILYGLAGIEQGKGDYPGAVPLFKQAYAAFRACGGPEDTETLRMGAYYAGALVRAGRAQEALPMLEAALPVWRRVFPPGNLSMAEELYFLSLAYLECGRYQDAERLAKEQIELEGPKVDPMDKRLGVAQFIWASALSKEGQYREALPHAQVADKLLSNGAISAAAKARAAQARALLVELNRHNH